MEKGGGSMTPRQMQKHFVRILFLLAIKITKDKQENNGLIHSCLNLLCCAKSLLPHLSAAPTSVFQWSCFIPEFSGHATYPVLTSPHGGSIRVGVGGDNLVSGDGWG